MEPPNPSPPPASSDLELSGYDSNSCGYRDSASDSESQTSDEDEEENPFEWVPQSQADSDREHGIPTDTTAAEAADEYEGYMDAEMDAIIATHPDPVNATHHPLIQPSDTSLPRPTRTLQDILHEMKRVTKTIDQRHSLAKQFARWLRDALLVPDKIDRAKVEAVLKKSNITWEQALRSKPEWVWERSGSRHQEGVEYDGHYDPWIEDDIDIVYRSLPFESPRESRPGYVNVSLFRRTEETFIVTALPQIVRDNYDIPRAQSSTIATEGRILDIPFAGLSGARSNRYDFLASVQDTKFAVTPIHTNEEYSLFNKALRPSGPFAAATGPPDFKRMAKWWSAQVDGKKIFYKFPEHFQAHFKTWNALRAELTTMQLTENARAEFMDIMRSDAHTSAVLDESFSPVVQGRKAAPSSAKIALRNLQIRDISDVPTASTSKTTPGPSRLPPLPRVAPPPPLQFQTGMGNLAPRSNSMLTISMWPGAAAGLLCALISSPYCIDTGTLLKKGADNLCVASSSSKLQCAPIDSPCCIDVSTLLKKGTDNLCVAFSSSNLQCAPMDSPRCIDINTLLKKGADNLCVALSGSPQCAPIFSPCCIDVSTLLKKGTDNLCVASSSSNLQCAHTPSPCCIDVSTLFKKDADNLCVALSGSSLQCTPIFSPCCIDIGTLLKKDVDNLCVAIV
ncbi:hypothetical protein B0H14DRAFT_3489350 [Mycena olivaceomarginata]|nr:hypothetical protein B0H14DRAFT_3489350 [Mycena olivaceomarginata]